jgi:hypothetical protein
VSWKYEKPWSAMCVSFTRCSSDKNLVPVLVPVATGIPSISVHRSALSLLLASIDINKVMRRNASPCEVVQKPQNVTHNPLVRGSNPSGPTTNNLRACRRRTGGQHPHERRFADQSGNLNLIRDRSHQSAVEKHVRADADQRNGKDAPQPEFRKRLRAHRAKVRAHQESCA